MFYMWPKGIDAAESNPHAVGLTATRRLRSRRRVPSQLNRCPRMPHEPLKRKQSKRRNGYTEISYAGMSGDSIVISRIPNVAVNQTTPPVASRATATAMPNNSPFNAAARTNTPAPKSYHKLPRSEEHTSELQSPMYLV